MENFEDLACPGMDPNSMTSSNDLFGWHLEIYLKLLGSTTVRRRDGKPVPRETIRECRDKMCTKAARLSEEDKSLPLNPWYASFSQDRNERVKLVDSDIEKCFLNHTGPFSAAKIPNTKCESQADYYKRIVIGLAAVLGFFLVIWLVQTFLKEKKKNRHRANASGFTQNTLPRQIPHVHFNQNDTVFEIPHRRNFSPPPPPYSRSGTTSSTST
jgi:hypothetical protein